MIKDGEDIVQSDYVISLEAGEAISARDSIYISASDGKAYKTDADDLTKIGFIGFAQEAASMGAQVTVKTWGVMPGFSGLTVGATYYVSGTAGAVTATKPSNFKVVGLALSATVIKITRDSTKRTRIYSTPDVTLGDSTTRFDVSNPAGTTFRYTWDGTGADPVINATTFPVGRKVFIHGTGMAAGNNGLFTVTGSGANYFEVTNASGVVEVDKTIGSNGIVTQGTIWTKPGNLKKIKVRGVGAGASGGNASTSGSELNTGSGGAAGGYAEKELDSSALASYEQVFVGAGAVSGGRSGRPSYFGSIVYFAQEGGTPTGGDINIPGCPGTPGESGSTGGQSGQGGDSPFGWGGRSLTSEANGNDGTGYGSGGGGAAETGGGGGTIGGSGAGALVMVEEEY